MRRLFFIVLASLTFLHPRFALAQTTQPDAPVSDAASATTDDQPVVTHHELTIGDRTIAYAATTGRLTFQTDEGKPRAHVFFVAYTLNMGEGGDAAERPITFVFNGGPGAAAVWLHLGAAGPKVIALDEQGEPLPPPARLVDNPSTWLLHTDLVFIDPVGTGYSRAAEGVEPREFFGVERDIAAVAEFIRRYLGDYRRWESPKFLAGESYGTTRAAGLSEHLLDEHGIAVSGLILISTVLDFATISTADNNTLPYALFLPTYTAVAHYHGRLAPELQQRPLDEVLGDAETWSLTRYISALTRGEDLPQDQRQEVARTLSQFTGLDEGFIDLANLRVSPSVFQKQLLQHQRRVIGRFDARITGFTLDPIANWPAYDPSLSYYLPIYTSAFNAYVRSALGYDSDLKYEPLSGEVQPWDFSDGGREGFLTVASRLRGALAKQPSMGVLIAAGRYDLATPYLAADYTVDQLNLPPDLRDNVSQTYYPAGHMLFHHAASRAELSRNIGLLIESAASTAVDAGRDAPAIESE